MLKSKFKTRVILFLMLLTLMVRSSNEKPEKEPWYQPIKNFFSGKKDKDLDNRAEKEFENMMNALQECTEQKQVENVTSKWKEEYEKSSNYTELSKKIESMKKDAIENIKIVDEFKKEMGKAENLEQVTNLTQKSFIKAEAMNFLKMKEEADHFINQIIKFITSFEDAINELKNCDEKSVALGYEKKANAFIEKYNKPEFVNYDSLKKQLDTEKNIIKNICNEKCEAAHKKLQEIHQEHNYFFFYDEILKNLEMYKGCGNNYYTITVEVKKHKECYEAYQNFEKTVKELPIQSEDEFEKEYQKIFKENCRDVLNFKDLEKKFANLRSSLKFRNAIKDLTVEKLITLQSDNEAIEKHSNEFEFLSVAQIKDIIEVRKEEVKQGIEKIEFVEEPVIENIQNQLNVPLHQSHEQNPSVNIEIEGDKNKEKAKFVKKKEDEASGPNLVMIIPVFLLSTIATFSICYYFNLCNKVCPNPDQQVELDLQEDEAAEMHRKSDDGDLFSVADGIGEEDEEDDGETKEKDLLEVGWTDSEDEDEEEEESKKKSTKSDKDDNTEDEDDDETKEDDDDDDKEKDDDDDDKKEDGDDDDKEEDDDEEDTKDEDDEDEESDSAPSVTVQEKLEAESDDEADEKVGHAAYEKKSLSRLPGHICIEVKDY